MIMPIASMYGIFTYICHKKYTSPMDGIPDMLAWNWIQQTPTIQLFIGLIAVIALDPRCSMGLEYSP